MIAGENARRTEEEKERRRESEKGRRERADRRRDGEKERVCEFSAKGEREKGAKYSVCAKVGPVCVKIMDERVPGQSVTNW